jgi:mycothiol synthase
MRPAVAQFGTMNVPASLPSGYRVRAPKASEAPDIDRLAAASDAALGAGATLSEDLLRQFWSRPRFVLEDDAWIVELGRGVVGYAQVWEEDSAHLAAFALVHPDHTGRGLGNALATLIEERAAQKASGEARLYSATTPEDEAGARLLAHRGYAWARRFSRMEVDLDEAPEAAAPPPGIHLRPLDPERDLQAAYQILEEAFQDHWDYTPTSYLEFLEHNVNRDDFDPTLWILAADTQGRVGVLSAGAQSDRGWVGQLGVLRAHRGRGIAAALLRQSFGEFWRRGLPRVGLSVDSDNLTGAVSLYERMGMRVVSSYDLWSRAVRALRP